MQRRVTDAIPIQNPIHYSYKIYLCQIENEAINHFSVECVKFKELWSKIGNCIPEIRDREAILLRYIETFTNKDTLLEKVNIAFDNSRVSSSSGTQCSFCAQSSRLKNVQRVTSGSSLFTNTSYIKRNFVVLVWHLQGTYLFINV